MSLRREIPRFATGRGNHSFAGMVMVGLERLLHLLPERFVKSLADQGRALQAELEAALGNDGVLLFPPYSQPAPFHRQPWFHPFDFECTAIFNVLQFPVTVVPTGFSENHLPVSVQVIAKRRMDALTVKAAQAIEEELGGWKRAEL
jgi:fatty acid amide hydrolase 2